VGRTYPDAETNLSRSYLEAVAKAVRDPVLLVGGWGVYFTVTSAYVRLHGRDYSFSRDIDLGFHLDPAWGVEQIRASSLAKSVRSLVKEGFAGEGFRLRMDFAHDGGRRLTEEESRGLQSYEIARLYVDPLVDYPHPLRTEALGFTPAEEPQLIPLFAKPGAPRLARVMTKLRLPPREVMLRMKLKAMPNRALDHKTQKDVGDVFALLSTYGRGPAALVTEVKDEQLSRAFLKRLDEFERADWDVVSAATGVAEAQVKTVLAALSGRGALSDEDRARAQSKIDELAKWGARIKSRYLEQKRSWQDTSLAGPWGAFVGGFAAESLGFSKRAGQKWGRRIATSKAPWRDSPPELSLRAESEEWVRALKAWADSHEVVARAGDRATGSAPLVRRYERILEVQGVLARADRGRALLEWAKVRGVRSLAA
jgi:hypothetical protein